MRIGIIIASDKGAAGEREDKSGPAIAAVVEEKGNEVVAFQILPDDREILAKEMKRMCDVTDCDIVFTSGGTGFSPRDVTPEATRDVIDRDAPGIPEAMRAASMQITQRAMLSRAVAGIRGRSLIVNLPGSPKGAIECLQVIMDAMPHAVEILRGGGECAR